MAFIIDKCAFMKNSMHVARMISYLERQSDLFSDSGELNFEQAYQSLSLIHIFAQEMMSLTLDFFTNLVQWCASASYSFWDASLVNVLLQAGAGVSRCV